MIIESVDALKSWLAKLLEPICDADPSALANYVVALVKKDKPEKELKAFCADQLDVFLQKETSGFVDKLFESLYTKSYLPSAEPTKAEAKAAGQEKEEVKEELCVKQSFQESVEEERESRKKKYSSPQRSRADSSEQRTREKKRDDGKWRDYDRYYDRSDLYREKSGWRRGRSKSRSKSRGLSRSRSRSRGRSKDRDGSRSGLVQVCRKSKWHRLQHSTHLETALVKGREHRERERSKYKSEKNDVEGSYNPVSASPSKSSEQYSSAQAIPNAVTVVAPAHHLESTTESWSNFFNNHNNPSSFGRNPPPKRRCQDYDERGYCVLGDLCQFDHGNDPLVVDEVSLPSMIPFPPPPPGLPPPPGMLLPPLPGPVRGLRLPVPQPHPQPPPPVVLPVPRPPLTQSSLINSRDQPGTSAVPSLAPIGARLPPPLPQNLLYTVSEPANIIIQTEPPIPITNNSSNVTRVVLEPDSRKRSPSSMECPPLKKPWLGKQVNNNQNKPGFLKKNQYTNTKLEVRKIPPELNNITQLNEHFSKFGTIVNIQVAFQNDPEAALIQYLSNDEARKAISSTEAVLSNRFIRVLWHRESEQQPPVLQQQPPPTPQALQHLQQQALATPPAVTMHSSLSKVMNKPLASGAYVLNKVPVKRRLGAAGGSQPELSQPGAGVEESQIFPTSTSHSKMLYSSPNLKTTLKSGAGSKPHDVQEALKKKQEAMKLQQDMRKKKQEMLEKQIECQKMLISKLEKNKAMKPEERAEIMKTLKELTGKISQLKDELKTSSTTSTPSKLKSKTEAQKELLDAELDFHKRLSSGEDTTELRKKLNQLQVEAARLGILPVGRGKTAPAQGRGRGRGRGGRGRGMLNHMVVDHRPKALTVGGFVEEEKDELLQHFSKFGDIEDLQEEDSPLSVVVTFKSRSEAENAANQGSRFKDRRLQISWHKPKVPSVSTEVEEEESKEEETETSDLFLHEDDDDDDEDEDESRSWRR
ncbi:RNA-binding protein 27 isoform X3 [Corvus cornix cornix]|uniref:RNA-binding protein 27 isoform X3 n=1 Tax=Corvus cornix cornix TaxID=932674 RepID=UPI00195248EB|nr:RNA-binding protein 27 isoform X3 [Corvus cornix cornix]XP_041872004.1 RNA-binding protein 27 isoform X3 [Corvus kubaryi]